MRREKVWHSFGMRCGVLDRAPFAPPRCLSYHVNFVDRKKERRSLLRAASYDSQARTLLDSFWKARGVVDPKRRDQLVQVAVEAGYEEEGELHEGHPLPGVEYTWDLEARAPQIIAVSHRLIQLQELLGGSADIDIVWMCVREPRLLTVPRSFLLHRLMDMKLSNSGSVTSVLRIVEHQPSLLVESHTEVDLEEAPDEQIPAWECGLLSDANDEWSRRFKDLCKYKRVHGDAHVGFRDGDSKELTRWCDKQRKDARTGHMTPEKRALLKDVEFEYEQDEAEWMRWYTELCRYQTHTGLVSPVALTSSKNFFLTNWCSVQRVAQRTGLLSKKRKLLLDKIQFDWTAADALS